MENNETAVSVLPVNSREVTAKDFFPVFTVQEAVQRKGMVNQFIGQVLRESEDYGTIPGAGTKKVLLKPGAEKLCSIFGLSVTDAEDKIIEDWTGEDHGGEPLFYYSYRCQLSRGDRFMGEAIGSCNSWESKYRYRWVPEEMANQRPDFAGLMKRGGVTMKFEPNFALDKKETTGQYGKPAEYWQMFEDAIKQSVAKNVKRKMGKREFDGWEMPMDQTQYRIPNPEVSDVINTCQKMAQKRALVAAVLVVTNCSDSFTQDIEDFGDGPSTPIHGGFPDDGPKVETGKQSESTKKPFPVEMLAYLEKVQKDKRKLPDVCTAMADKMIMRGGKAGSEAYDRVADKWAEKIKNTDDVKAMLTDLWEAFQSLPEHETPFDGPHEPGVPF